MSNEILFNNKIKIKELQVINPKTDMDYYYGLEGRDGWIAIGMNNCINQKYFIVIGDNNINLGIVGVYDINDERNITHIVIDKKYRGRDLTSQFYKYLIKKKQD